jgi:hypothetical protein
MRPIPPQIWVNAILVGKLLRAIAEVDSPHARAALAIIQKIQERFLDYVRKEKGK